MWKDQLGAIPLQRSAFNLKSYSGHTIPVVGETTVHVKYSDQEADLPVIVTRGKGTALMGRDWLSKVKLNWEEMSKIYRVDCPKPTLADLK